MDKEELEEFYRNANEEEILKHEVELMSHGNISSANLSTCETYGLSGNCGSKCPKFKDKSCEVYEEVLEKENTNLKQENKQLKQLNKVIYIDKSEKVLDELERWLKEQVRDVYDKEHLLALDSSYATYTTERRMSYMHVLDKIKELKGELKNG